MKRNNKVVKFAIFVLLITIIAFALVAGTYAKYTTEVSGSDTVRVAKWSIKVNGTEITTVQDETVTFDLFNTIYDSDGTTTESDVANGLIAPGTSGSFDLQIENLSEVNAEYSIAFEMTNAANVPLEFSTDGKTWGNIDSIESTATAIAMSNGTSTVNVKWRWQFEGNHTDIGIAAQTAPQNVEVTATITVDQVD